MTSFSAHSIAVFQLTCFSTKIWKPTSVRISLSPRCIMPTLYRLFLFCLGFRLTLAAVSAVYNKDLSSPVERNNLHPNFHSQYHFDLRLTNIRCSAVKYHYNVTCLINKEKPTNKFTMEGQFQRNVIITSIHVSANDFIREREIVLISLNLLSQ